MRGRPITSTISIPLTPAWAARVWASDEALFAELPSTVGNTQHNTVMFPNTLKGLDALLTMIRSRRADVGFCSKGDPTQHQIDMTFDKAKVKRGRGPQVATTPEQREAMADIFRELGIIP